ncbi:MAG: alpha/beta hydrolase family protein [Opitutaceae bacterium]
MPASLSRFRIATALVLGVVAVAPLRAAAPPERDASVLEFLSIDGRRIPAVLSMPRGAGPFPAVVTIHGGEGDREINYLRTLAVANDATPTVTALNTQPWAILSIDYRNGLFGLEEEDVVAGIRFAKTLPRVDPARVGVLGGSHGGNLALRAATKLGREFRCVAVGSPWMTDPFVYMLGRPDEPPLSLLSASSRQIIVGNGRQLYSGLLRRTGSEAEARRVMLEFSIEANAAKILVPSLFLTSLGDEQAPHLLIKPTFDLLRAAGRDVTVFTVEQSRHGFYWGRDEGGARTGLGPKTAVELAEEQATRDQIIAFFTRHFAAASAPAQPPASLVNLSVRGRVGTGDEVLISGFVLGAGEARPVLLRAAGPALAGAPFNVPGTLARPVLSVFRGGQRLATNTGWGTAPNAAEIRTAAQRVGAFPLPEGGADSALLLTLPPGAYTLQIAGLNDTAGLALAEVYESP